MQSTFDRSFEEDEGGAEYEQRSRNVLDSTALPTASVAVLEKNWDMQLTASEDDGDANFNADEGAPTDEFGTELSMELEEEGSSSLTMQDQLLQSELFQNLQKHLLQNQMLRDRPQLLLDYNNAASEDPLVDADYSSDNSQELQQEEGTEDPDDEDQLDQVSDVDESDAEGDAEEDETLEPPPISGLAELSLQREQSVLEFYSQLLNANASANDKPAGHPRVTLGSLEAFDVLKFYELLD